MPPPPTHADIEVYFKDQRARIENVQEIEIKIKNTGLYAPPAPD